MKNKDYNDGFDDAIYIILKVIVSVVSTFAVIEILILLYDIYKTY